MKKIILLLPLSVLMASCLKTTEDIKKEQAVQGLPSQVEQSQKLMAEMTIRMNELENRLKNYTGNIEEIEYRQQKLIPSTQKEMQDKIVNQAKEINSLRKEMAKNKAFVENLSSEVNAQKKYLTKVTSTLKNFSKSKNQAKSQKNYFREGMKLYQSKKYSSAEQKLLLSLNEKISAAQRNRVYQALGHIKYSQKDFNQSNVYFSKIFSRYPRSSMAPDALLHIARALSKQKKKEEAKEAYKMFLRNYPKNKLSAMATKELNAL